MSFYGDIKRVLSSPFVFDKIYPNRKAMEDNAESDNVYIGRYVLVKYTTNGSGDYFNKYELTDDIIVEDGEESYSVKSQKVVLGYKNNATIDITNYEDTFDGTVWQKIYTSVNSNGIAQLKYILIAELNAATPRLTLDVIKPKYYVNEDTTAWYSPEIVPSASSEDAYVFKLPNTLHLSLGAPEEDFYGKDLIANPAERHLFSGIDIGKTPFDPEYNYMKAITYRDGTKVDSGDYDEERLEVKFYAFGQMISDLYDVMYGVPSGGTGPRPFYTDDIASLLSNYDKGLVGILTSLNTDAKGDAAKDLSGRTLLPGMYYYLTSKWCDAEEDPDSFIENIPKVIGSSAELDEAKCHYRINFNSKKLASS